MIHGIGTDLCAVSRMEAVLARRGPRFAAKLLMPAELAQFQQRQARHPRRAAQFLATRFAAKEALGKATGLAVRPPMALLACEVVADDLGRPGWRLHGALAEWFAQRGLVAHLSLSDEEDMAAAFVVVEQRGAPGAPAHP